MNVDFEIDKLPTEGVLFNKDYSLKLEYEVEKNYKSKIVRFKVFKINNEKGTKRSYVDNFDEPLIMTEEQFKNYIYTESYIS